MSIFDIFRSLEQAGLSAKNKNASGSVDYIICGLGNPGTKYEDTRHNCGFMTVDKIAENFNITVKKLKFKSLTATINFGGHNCLLMKPQTFMNLSGQALTEAMGFYKIEPQNVLIILDDLNGDVGNIRIKRNGSDGGHNGMKNIIYLTGQDNFPRIKIGIGAKPHPDFPLADWVTSRFKKDEGANLIRSLENAAAAAEIIVSGEIEKAMNKYNRK